MKWASSRSGATQENIKHFYFIMEISVAYNLLVKQTNATHCRSCSMESNQVLSERNTKAQRREVGVQRQRSQRKPLWLESERP